MNKFQDTLKQFLAALLIAWAMLVACQHSGAMIAVSPLNTIQGK